MANFTDAQVAAYFRDNKLDDAGIQKAAGVFGLSENQISSARGLLSSGASSVNDASNAYAAAVAANPSADADNKAFYNAQTGTGWGVTTPAPLAPKSLGQQVQDAQRQAATQSGFTQSQLSSAGIGEGSPGFMQSDPSYNAKKRANDQMTIAGNMAGRSQSPGATFRSAATFNPVTNLIELRDRNGVLLTSFQPGTTGSEFGHLDRLGADTESFKASVADYLRQNPANAEYITAMTSQYQPRFGAAADASYLRAVIDPTQDASAFFSGNKTPSTKEFMDMAGVDYQTAASMLSSHGLGAAADALVDWQKVMSSSDPARALNAAYAAIAADPRLSQVASQSVSKNYQGWNIDGQSVAGGASGGGVGGGGVGGGAPGGMVGGGSSVSAGGAGVAGGAVVERAVNAPTETIEGRIQNLLGTDAQGNYTNPVVQQAANRALQQFSGRGLLNSSMAQQAAIEAATSKAIEIAGPDAQTYFAQGRANQDAANVFERDARGYAQENSQLDKQLNFDMQKFDRDLKYRYDALKIDQSSQTEARALAQKYAIEMENIKAVNSAYDLYLRRISDIDANPDYSAETKAKMKNEAGRDFDIYAKTKSIAESMNLGNRFSTPEPKPNAKPEPEASGPSGSGMLYEGGG